MIEPHRTSAAAELITVTEAKLQLRVDHSADDALIGGLVATASAQVAALTGLIVGPETWQWRVGPQRDDLVLPIAPVSALTAIAWIDRDGASQVGVAADFDLFGDQRRVWLRPKRGRSWPASADREDAITLTLAAGLAQAPPALRTAALMIVVHLYDNRDPAGDGGPQVPAPVAALVEPHRRAWVVA